MAIREFALSDLLSRRRGFGFGLTLVLAALAMLAWGAASASAEVTYPIDGQLVPSSGWFELLEANSVAVNDFNGDAFVADSGAGVIDVFDSARAQIATLDGSTTPAGSFGGGAVSVAANNATGEVYVLDSTDNVVDAFDASGKYTCQITGGSIPSFSECNGVAGSATPAGALNAPHGIAIDQATGDVYVIDANNGAVDIFSADGAYLRQISLASVPDGFDASNTRGIAVDDFNGHIYLSDSGQVRLYEFDSAGNYLTTWTGGPCQSGSSAGPLESTVCEAPAGSFGGGYLSVAANNATGRVYVTETGHEVTDEFDSSGKYLAQFGTSYKNPRGTAVDQATGRIYISHEVISHENQSVVSIEHREIIAGPHIDSTSSTNVDANSATLDANINPNNTPTSYYFQYGTSTSYGTEVPIGPGTSIGSAEGALEVSQPLRGLSPRTTYHYRVVVLSELVAGKPEALDGPDETFTTQALGGESALPDGRVWELASPVDKRGATIEPPEASSGSGSEAGLAQAAASGGAVTYSASLPTEADPEGFPDVEQVISTRGVSGWSSRDISVPHDKPVSKYLGFGQEYRFFSEDLSSGVVEPFGPFTALSVRASERTPYVRQSICDTFANEECYLPLVTSKEPYADVPAGTDVGGSPGSAFGNYPFEDATPDLKHVIVTHSGNEAGLYEWSADEPPSTALQLVTILPTAEGGGPSPGDGGLLGSGEGTGLQGGSPNVRHALSDDGSRVFFSDSGHLYVRDTTKHESVRLDMALGVSEPTKEDAMFQIANADGNRVFFTAGRLTEHSAETGDLYMCALVEEGGKLTCVLSDLTPEESGREALVNTIVGASEDGSYVYFVANGAIGNSTRVGECGSSMLGATCPMYVMHYNGREWEAPRVVAVLSSLDDRPDWESQDLERDTARVSPSGRFISFMSDRSLTGYDSHDVNSGSPDEELFLYDADSAKIVCASCDPTGARPAGFEYGENDRPVVGGDRVWSARQWLAADVPGWTGVTQSLQLYQPRYLTDSGQVFFDSADALVPQDINGTVDVYEFEPIDSGHCADSNATFSAESDGCVQLMSSGTSADESGLLDASGNGGDVFFLTASKLVGQDADSAFDVYDAHECSSDVPCLAPAAASPPECTTADACRAAPSPQPSVFGSPSSATFSGAGNVIPHASKAVIKAKSLTRAQKLARALRACQTKRNRGKRTECRRQARKRYDLHTSAKSKAKKKGNG
jgi:DNA-binding beta-propeller fold protein YncE